MSANWVTKNVEDANAAPFAVRMLDKAGDGSAGFLFGHALDSNAFSGSVTFTRPADTNPYAAGDVMGPSTGSTAALQFSNMGIVGSEILLTSARLMTFANALISGEAGYRLYLYNALPASAYGDNAAWDLPAGDRAAYLGYVDLGQPVDMGSTCSVELDGINKQLKLVDANLYGYLVTLGAFTPASAAQRFVDLHSVGV